MIQDVFIIGATGNVGKTIVSQIFDKGDTDDNVHTNPTRIVGLASRTEYIYNPSGITEPIAKEFAARKYVGGIPRIPELSEKNGATDLLVPAHKRETEHLLFIDATSAPEMLEFHKRIIRHTPMGIVTANKVPLATSDFETFQYLTDKVKRYGFSCTVMAGAEIVDILRDLKDVNDLPSSIEGSFSGTLGYITSQLELGRTFSEIVTEAKALQYTEPHPASDLGGIDVMRKILILARTAGYDVKPENITLEPLIPAAYLSIEDVSKFMGSLSALDDHFSKMFADAAKKGMTLRYVAAVDATGCKPKITIGLKEVPTDSPLGMLKGTMNKVVIKTPTYPNGYKIEAAGAGVDITAQNVRRDMLRQLHDRRTNHRVLSRC
jgi:homoserine dehydrogenase